MGENTNIETLNRPLLRNIRATVAYDGSGFSGSQLQASDRTVASELNKALSKILAHPVRVKMASRTDAGVHSTGQVISFRTSAPRTVEEIYKGMNSLLPGDLRLTDVREADFGFHPRYSAVAKVYLYRILRAKELPPTFRHYVLFIEEHKPFDLDLLAKLASEFEGEHDYRSFSPRLEDGENPAKRISRVQVSCNGQLIEIRFIGSGFLYQMVRRMAGLMIAVVQGREHPGAVRKALKNPDKGSVKYNADPKGLFLEKVI
ncbi:MAG: tRNA pseudouridine(38-40) synthase TruA, partial [bacterium]|nr:tRNA pseudouridine(38-40) synthase TruA [bacterium]